ncbi:hypothetical protein [Mesorhizobium sp. LjRoot246]|uniref:hypothetical protein n=1 Tax=Mesorhizobium sp. LjRoot246 TaxID=3342294 RepID=UPI003ECF56F2
MPTLPENNLDYPVHIAIGNTFGSGFYLNAPAHTWLITAKHVLFKQNGDLIADGALLTSFTNRFANRLTAALNLNVLQANGHILFHAIADVAAIRLGDVANANLQMYPEITLNGAPGVGIVGMAVGNVISIDHAQIANEVYLFGYPGSVGSVGQIEPLKPLLRRGCIAGINSLNRTIIIDAPVYQGNSGGLVIEVSWPNIANTRYKGLGVVSQFCPFIEQMKSLHFGTVNTSIENSGYSIVEPIDKVFEMLGIAMPEPEA